MFPKEIKCISTLFTKKTLWFPCFDTVLSKSTDVIDHLFVHNLLVTHI